MAKRQSTPDSSIKIRAGVVEAAGLLVELFGHVMLVEEYALIGFKQLTPFAKHS